MRHNLLLQHNRAMGIRHCIMCGIPLRRPDATTCGPVCRRRKARRKEAINREVQAIQDALENLKRYADRWPDLRDVIIDACSKSVTRTGVTLYDLEIGS